MKEFNRQIKGPKEAEISFQPVEEQLKEYTCVGGGGVWRLPWYQDTGLGLGEALRGPGVENQGHAGEALSRDSRCLETWRTLMRRPAPGQWLGSSF